jgi:hypothetical protein
LFVQDVPKKKVKNILRGKIMSDSNEVNNKDFLKNVILQYYNITFSKEDNNNRPICLRINQQVYQDFINTLLDNHYRVYGNVGKMVEALMRLFIDVFKTPKIIQTTLFYKPTINIKENIQQNINIATKLELKIVTENITSLLDALEKRKGDPNFYLERLKEVLPKAIRLYEKTNDTKMKELLEKIEKWI